MKNIKNTIDYISEKSIFPSGEILGLDKNNKRNNIFDLLKKIFINTGESNKEAEKNYKQHILFQLLFDEYLFEQDLREFAFKNGYILNYEFNNIEEFIDFLANNPKTYVHIKKGHLNIAIIFDRLIPIKIVVGMQQKTLKEINDNIENLRAEFKTKFEKFCIEDEAWKNFKF